MKITSPSIQISPTESVLVEFQDQQITEWERETIVRDDSQILCNK